MRWVKEGNREGSCPPQQLGVSSGWHRLEHVHEREWRYTALKVDASVWTGRGTQLDPRAGPRQPTMEPGLQARTH